jgi:hypothetical protein
LDLGNRKLLRFDLGHMISPVEKRHMELNTSDLFAYISRTQGFIQVVNSKINLGSQMLKRYRGSAIGDKPIAYFSLGFHLQKFTDVETLRESVIGENSLAWSKCSS